MPRHAVAIGADGNRNGRFTICLGAVACYGLTSDDARNAVDGMVSTISDEWADVAGGVGLTRDERPRCEGRELLSAYARHSDGRHRHGRPTLSLPM